jgi:flagellar motor switch/type III secretory pathway protein FliN
MSEAELQDLPPMTTLEPAPVPAEVTPIPEAVTAAQMKAAVEAVPSPTSLAALMSIPIDLELVFASLRMPVSRLMELAPGSEIDLGAQGGNEVTLFANGTPFALCELLLLDEVEKRLGVRIKRILKGDAA